MRRGDSRESIPLSIRFSRDERNQLEQLAGNRTLSSFVRECVLSGTHPRIRQARKPTKDDVALARLLAMLGQSRLAESLSRLAIAADQGWLPLTPETEEELRKACTSVNAMRGLLLQALGLRPSGTDRGLSP